MIRFTELTSRATPENRFHMQIDQIKDEALHKISVCSSGREADSYRRNYTFDLQEALEKAELSAENGEVLFDSIDNIRRYAEKAKDEVYYAAFARAMSACA